MRNGADGNGLRPGNKRGTGSATSVSPDLTAKHHSRRSAERHDDNGARQLFRVGSEGTTRREPRPEVFWPEESDAAELDIEYQFRRKLDGLAHLSRDDKLYGRRAARAWRRAALKAIRERKAAARYAARLQRRLQAPVPH